MNEKSSSKSEEKGNRFHLHRHCPHPPLHYYYPTNLQNNRQSFKKKSRMPIDTYHTESSGGFRGCVLWGLQPPYG